VVHAALDQRHRIDDRDLPRPLIEPEALARRTSELRWCAAGKLEVAKQFLRSQRSLTDGTITEVPQRSGQSPSRTPAAYKEPASSALRGR
jgi:hypothetical protein